VQLLTYAGLQIPARLSASFAKVRDAIERDDFRTADLKKLTGRDYYRAKLDYDSRLLVQFVRYRDRRACLALELVEQHAYDRSRFLRGARVDEAQALDSRELSETSLAEDSKPVRYLHPGRVEFHVLDKPISFDDRQSDLYVLPLPLVLVGCAGSGKTALTLMKLRTIPGEVLYVTESAYLAESAGSLYFAHGYENADQSVDFLSYRKLLESIAVPKGRPVTLRDFRPFFERHRQGFKFTSAHQLFEELRGVLTASADGPLTEEAYVSLGVRQSIYEPKERPTVHAFASKYRAWLDESGLYDSNLLAHDYVARAERRYDAVVVDEIQDLTNAELSLVLALLKEPRFLLCGDANQIVHPNFFSWSKVKSLFYTREDEALAAPIHVLDVNYRSSVAICALANGLLKVKNARFGSIDRESTVLVRPATDVEGRATGLLKKEGALRELERRVRGSARVAVIVLSEERKAEAKRWFSTPLVFSVHEAKGLEYDTVILFDMVSGERENYREIAAGLSRADVDEGELVYARAKDKGDKSLEVYKFFVNALYVALTRAVEAVYVVESDASHPLLGLLNLTFSEDVSCVTAKASTLEDWQREARRLDLQGKTEQADAIRQTILRHAPVPWTVIDDKGFDEVHAKVFMKGSVFNKAKQQLYEFAAFHELSALAMDIQVAAGYRPPRRYAESIAPARARFVPIYEGDTGRVMSDIARYGIEHRNMMSLTPLMMAALAGNVTLVETLLERGARLDAVDAFGRMPLHFALRRAFHEPGFAEEKLGALYELLCPPGIDVEVDGRLVRLSRSQGEFFVFVSMVALFHDTYGRSGYRRDGFTATMLSEELLARFPRSVLPEERRRRVYWNGVLARGEVDSTYRPARRLWRRERQGHYVPSPEARVRTSDERGTETLRSAYDALRIDLLDRHAHAAVHGSAPKT
jgi:Ankyrin repeats (many copies)/UvrD-like helicase C-terminal domain/AAA domain